MTKIIARQFPEFGPFKTPTMSHIIGDGDTVDQYNSDPSWMSHDHDMSFLYGPKASLAAVYAKLVKKDWSQEALNDEWLVGFAIWELPSGNALIAAFDSDLGVWGLDDMWDYAGMSVDNTGWITGGDCHVTRDQVENDARGFCPMFKIKECNDLLV